MVAAVEKEDEGERPKSPTPERATPRRRRQAAAPILRLAPAAYSPGAKETASADVRPCVVAAADLGERVSASQTSATISLAPATTPIASTDPRAIVQAPSDEPIATPI